MQTEQNTEEERTRQDRGESIKPKHHTHKQDKRTVVNFLLFALRKCVVSK
jgi:hypothetical protein